MFADRPDFDEATVAELAKVARLDLTDDRKAAVAPAISGVYRLIDLLDRIDLGDVPPATAFDARWE